MSTTNEVELEIDETEPEDPSDTYSTAPKDRWACRHLGCLHVCKTRKVEHLVKHVRGC